MICECETERVLATLLHLKGTHVGGKSRVLKRIERGEGEIGLIDEDPSCEQPPSLQMYRIEYEGEGIKVLVKGGNRIVMLCPNFEEWVLTTSKESGVDPKKYGLPDDPERLHEVAGARTDRLKKGFRSLSKQGELE
ncbi:MAG: hypothetical protein QXW77_03490 [Candidatus Hadarchaeales archaeon]